MDTERFDRIATTLAETDSRRGVFRTLAAAALGAAGLAALVSEDADARRKNKKRKKKDKKRKDRRNRRDDGSNTGDPNDQQGNDEDENTGGNTGTGTCQTDADCAPNQSCFNVNGLRGCFCKPEQVCGQVCCPAGLSCANPNTSSCVA